MPGFKFRYDKILQVRFDEENEKKQILAEKIADMNRINEKLRSLIDQKSVYDSSVLKKLSSGIGSEELGLIDRSKRWYKEEIALFSERLDIAKGEVEKAKENLILAVQEVKKMEKLKEKALEEYEEEENRNFSNMIDGVVNYQSAMKR